MTKKWLDSIEKQRRRIDLKKRYKQTYRHTDRVNDKKIVDSYARRGVNRDIRHIRVEEK